MMLALAAALVLAVALAPAYAPAHAEPECLMVRKASTQEFDCGFPGSVEKLYERGWGTPGKAGWNVCTEHTSAVNGCIVRSHDYTAFDRCYWPVMQDWCLPIRDLPTTVQDCKDKYYFAYLAQFSFSSHPVSFLTYSGDWCDLPRDAGLYGEDCQRWWDRHLELSGDASWERGFVVKYCLNGTEPDWDSWGTFYLPRESSNYDIFDGYLASFVDLATSCKSRPCLFEHGGANSTVQCPYAASHSPLTAQFVRDPQTGAFSCELLPNPDFDCPDYKDYNGTHFYDFWFDDGAMRFTCDLVEFVDSDADGVSDDVDGCPGQKEDDYSPYVGPLDTDWTRWDRSAQHDGCPGFP